MSKYIFDFDLKRVAMAWPAGNGKTTWLSTILPIWALCKDPNMRIALVQKGLSQAQDVMLDIQRVFDGNEKFKQFYGQFKPEQEGYPWSTSRMRIAPNTDQHAKTHNLHGFGVGSRDMLGQRFHLLIPDDVVTDENSATPELRAKIRTWWSTSVEKTLVGSLMGPYGIIRMVGTAFFHDDLLFSIRDIATCEIGPDDWRTPDQLTDEEKSGWIFIRKDAEVGMQAGTALWVDQLPYKVLNDMKHNDPQGIANYYRRMRNEVTNPDTQVFKQIWFEGGFDPETGVHYPGCFDKNRKVGDIPVGPPMHIINGTDPSSGRESADTGEFAHVVLGRRDDDEKFYVIDLFHGVLPEIRRADVLAMNSSLEGQTVGMPPDCVSQIGTIIHRHHKYNAESTVVERNGVQQAWIDTIKAHDRLVKVDPHFTTQKHKVSREIGIPSMAAIVENGDLRLPYGDAKSKRLTNQLVEQMVRYPDNTLEDLPAALFFAFFKQRRRATPQVATMADWKSGAMNKDLVYVPPE